MTTEERLARVLQEEADQVEPDLARLHASTRSRIRDLQPRRRRRTWVPVLVATLVLCVLAGAALLRLVDLGSDRAQPAGTPRRGGVDTAFTCPAQITADEADRAVDDALLVDLRDGPAAAARVLGAPRYSYREDGDRAVLRLGNADGTLAATATFRRSGDEWVLDTTRRCTGADRGISVPGGQDLRLGRRGSTPYRPKTFGLDPASAVFVDDRTSYDESGLARHRSVWAVPCERHVCVYGGVPDSLVIGEIRAGAPPDDITDVLLEPDSMVGRHAGLVLWATYDADGGVASVTSEHRDGTTRAAEVFRGAGWTGRLLLLLDDPDAVRRVTVTSSDGSAVHYRPEQIAK